MKMGKGSMLFVVILVVGFGWAGYQADKIVGIVPSQEYSVAPDNHVVLFDAGSGSVGKRVLELSPLLKVTKFIDGDTVWIAYLPKTPVDEKLRLLQIDTPERGEPLYDEAGVALEKLINAAKTVYLEFPGGEKIERDKYGRVLCYLVTEDGKCLNVEVVRLGYSTYWTKYGRSEKYEEAFKAAEAEAKSKKLGIWGLSPEQFKKVDAPKKPEKKK